MVRKRGFSFKRSLKAIKYPRFYFKIWVICIIYYLVVLAKRMVLKWEHVQTIKLIRHWESRDNYFKNRVVFLELKDCLPTRNKSIPSLSEPLKSLKECYYEAKFVTLHNLILPCVAKNTNFDIQIDSYRFQVDRSIEGKYYIPFRPGRIQNYFSSNHSQIQSPTKYSAIPCFYAMLGIGKKISVEKQIKQLYPRCSIVGFDSDSRMLGHFHFYGTAIPIGVALHDVTNPINLTNETENVAVKRGLLHLLDAYLNGTRFLHFCSMDMEGDEAELLIPGLTNNGPLGRDGLVICQLDIELHKNVDLTLIQFKKYWKRILQETPYIPIHVEKFYIQQKITLIHSTDERCEHLFAFKRIVQY